MSVNNITLVGNIGRDARVKTTPGGTAVTEFQLATDNVWYSKTNGSKNERTDWHDIVIFGSYGENIAHKLTKGSLVSVEGRIRTRIQEVTLEDGSKFRFKKVDIVASNKEMGVKFLNMRRSEDIDHVDGSDFADAWADNK